MAGWRKLNDEKPTSKSPIAWAYGKHGRLRNSQGFWTFNYFEETEHVSIPACLIYDVLFLDDNTSQLL